MKTSRLEFSAQEARRIALYAHGFLRDDTQPNIPKSPSSHSDAIQHAIGQTVAHTGLLQIDTINYYARSHYLPVYSRTGTYQLPAFDEHVFDLPDPQQGAPYIEYRTHELAIMPAEDFLLWQWRMKRYRDRQRDPDHWVQQHRQVIRRVKAELRDRGPLTAAQLGQEKPSPRKIPYWSTMRSEEKHALEWLFHSGELVSAGREKFQRRYGLPDQVINDTILSRSSPSESAAVKELVHRAVKFLGIGTTADIRDYFRINNLNQVKSALQQLAESGAITQASVADWGQVSDDVWIDTALLTSPQLSELLAGNINFRDTILSPFDPLVWYRPRAERMHHFDYRIEIYVPEAKRQYGYYCLPILLDERIVGRFDMKADRKQSTLDIRSSWSEPHILPSDAARIAALMMDAATWQGLDHIIVQPNGNYHAELSAALHLAGSTLG